MSSMDEKTKRDSERVTLKIFFGFFGIVLVLAIIVIAGVYFLESGRANRAAVEQERIRVDLMRQNIKKIFSGITADLEILSSDQELKEFLSEEDDDLREDFVEELTKTATSKKVYDQIRIIDLDGDELIRIDHENGEAKQVPAANLQYKGDRKYFIESLSLEKNEIYISLFDLNVELGVIEKPYQPTLRFATPVYNESGEKKAIMVLNYDGNDLINTLKAFYVEGEGEVIFVNNQGYYYISADKDDEWGFMFEEKKDRTLAVQDPELWNNFLGNQKGSLIRNDGVYFFETVIPNIVSSNSQIRAFQDQEWYLISRVDHEDITRQLEDDLHDLVIFSIFFIMISGVGVFLVSFSVSKRIIAERQAKNLNELLKIINKILRHDVLGKLTGIRGAIELYQSDNDPEALQMAHDSTLAGIKLVKKMKHLEGVMPKEINLKNMSIAETINEQLKEFPIEIEVNGDAVIQADDALSAVFDNLIKNAIKHGHAKRVVITIHEFPDEVEIEVSDDGQGVSKDIEGRLFEEGVTTGDEDSTGIGLYIVKKTINRYGGDIAFKKSKRGARFIIRIPK